MSSWTPSAKNACCLSSQKFSKGRTAMLFSGSTARAVASGEVGLGANWRDKLQIPNPMANATLLTKAVIITDLPRLSVPEELAAAAAVSSRIFADFRGSAISSG
jgi:hypothetical protein